jgi:hypothetical protein
MELWFTATERTKETMDIALLRAIEKLRGLPVPVLQSRYRAVTGEPARSSNRQFLARRIAWRLQAEAEGGLSERARQRASAIADDADLRTRSPQGFWNWPAESVAVEPAPNTAPVRFVRRQRDARLPMPGALLTRHYRGADIVVRVLEEGFEYRSRRYRSLSAIAREVTGTHWNGLLFFSLTERKNG